MHDAIFERFHKAKINQNGVFNNSKVNVNRIVAKVQRHTLKLPSNRELFALFQNENARKPHNVHNK